MLTIHYPETLIFNAPGKLEMKHDFGNTIKSFGVALQGFKLEYGLGVDHEVQSIGVEIVNSYLTNEDTTLNATVELNLNDNNKHQGKGEVTIVMLADIGPI